MKAVTTTGRWRVPWIEALPDGWEFVSAKRLFKTRPTLASVDEPQLAATQAYGVIEQADYERRVGRKVTKLNKNLDKRRLVKRDDFIISMRSFEGGLERAWAEGGIRSSYIVLKPAADINVGYYQYLFKSQPYIQALRATGNFIRDGQDLNFANFSLVDLPYPPPEDQALIARYLGWHGAMTARLVRAKRRLIGLLNEQKQSIIHRAVTRGLNPAAKLRPSGVDWLGDVPEHWEVGPLKRLVRMQSGETITATLIDEAGAFPVYGGNGLRGYTSRSTHSGQFILIGRQGALCGNVHLVEGEFFASEHAIVAHPRIIFDAKWLAAVVAVMNLNQYSVAAAQPGLSVERIAVLKMPIPPLEEQRALAMAIQAETRGIVCAASEVRREINFIQEFRTRLIADVVTGQLDVRALAAGLPDMAEFDTAADLTDKDDLGEDADTLADEEEVA